MVTKAVQAVYRFKAAVDFALDAKAPKKSADGLSEAMETVAGPQSEAVKENDAQQEEMSVVEDAVWYPGDSTNDGSADGDGEEPPALHAGARAKKKVSAEHGGRTRAAPARKTSAATESKPRHHSGWSRLAAPPLQTDIDENFGLDGNLEATSSSAGVPYVPDHFEKDLDSDNEQMAWAIMASLQSTKRQRTSLSMFQSTSSHPLSRVPSNSSIRSNG